MNKLLQRFAAALVVFSILLAPAAAQTQPNTGNLCTPAGVAFGFFNGVRTTRLQANRNLQEFKIIHGVSTARGDRIKYQLFYNYTEGFDDFVETFDQRLREQSGLLAGRVELFFTTNNGGGSWWTSITQTVSEAIQIRDALIDLERAAVVAGLANLFRSPPTAVNYQEHRSLIDTLVLEVPKLLFVAHSQGNLFVNAAYDYAVSKTSASAVGVVHIAPASPRTTGPHTLADLDLVINALRPFGTVPSITHSIPGYALRPAGLNFEKDIKGHGLLEIYLNPALVTADEIRTNINTKLASLVAAPIRAATGFFTATLTWDGLGDVDLHTFEPNGSHVFYASRVGSVGFLDVDNTQANGPEHYYASCDAAKLLTGTYRIAVANFSRADSRQATVQVASVNGVLGTTTVVLGGATGSTPSRTLFNVAVSKNEQTGAFSVALQP